MRVRSPSACIGSSRARLLLECSFWSCENEGTLAVDLKQRLGFSGWVMSDWGATHSPSIVQGLDQVRSRTQAYTQSNREARRAGTRVCSFGSLVTSRLECPPLVLHGSHRTRPHSACAGDAWRELHGRQPRKARAERQRVTCTGLYMQARACGCQRARLVCGMHVV